MRTRITLVIAGGFVLACVINEMAYHRWPHRDCVQVGEYTCLEQVP